MHNLRIIFAGTPDFAASHLQALLDAGCNVIAAYTQPDRPAGRGNRLTASPVKLLAQQHHIRVEQPESLRNSAAQQTLASLQADLMIVVAYGLLLPQEVLDTPRLGCINVHGSLLPRWRGAAPIQRAIWAGDAETGVTIMQMDAGLDTGDMLLVEKTPIAPTDTTAVLHDRLADLGGRMIVEALELAACGGLQPVPQPAEGVTYAHKIEKAESEIDWSLPAHVIGQRIRAFDPFPGASTALQGEAIKVWGYEIDSCSRLSNERCGQILASGPEGVTVACGEGGALRLTTLQRAGGKRLPVADFLRGFPLPVGQVLGASTVAA